jgi:hypothetical protein
MRRRRSVHVLILTALLCAAALSWGLLAQAGDSSAGLNARGGGTTMVRGGTGAPDFTPVITKFAFHWRGGSGGFECLALAPSASAGARGSGNFNTNVMYVTGKIDSARVRGGTLVLTGSATVTGIGAGTDEAFTARATRGGPGASLVLEVSGLTFDEILVEGQIQF